MATLKGIAPKAKADLGHGSVRTQLPGPPAMLQHAVGVHCRAREGPCRVLHAGPSLLGQGELALHVLADARTIISRC